jgi:hypothetical protein
MAKETSSFPTMGESLIGQVVNMSGARSPYTKPGAKFVTAKSDNQGIGEGTKANRSGTTASSNISETNGPTGKIVAKICYSNEGSEAGKTQRNLKKVSGGSSFYGARAAGGNTGNV